MIGTYYPQLIKIFLEISADNGGCTVDEFEKILEGLNDEQLRIIASGEESEQKLIMDVLADRCEDRPLVDSLQAFLNHAFDGPSYVPRSFEAAVAWTRDNQATYDILQLIHQGEDIPLSTIEGWTDEQCKQAEDYAGAVHLKASDNDDVVVPPIPEHLKVARQF